MPLATKPCPLRAPTRSCSRALRARSECSCPLPTVRPSLTQPNAPRGRSTIDRRENSRGPQPILQRDLDAHGLEQRHRASENLTTTNTARHLPPLDRFHHCFFPLTIQTTPPPQSQPPSSASTP